MAEKYFGVRKISKFMNLLQVTTKANSFNKRLPLIYENVFDYYSNNWITSGQAICIYSKKGSDVFPIKINRWQLHKLLTMHWGAHQSTVDFSIIISPLWISINSNKYLWMSTTCQVPALMELMFCRWREKINKQTLLVCSMNRRKWVRSRGDTKSWRQLLIHILSRLCSTL